MPNVIKKAILQKKINEVMTTLHVQTEAKNVIFDDANSVADKLASMQEALTAAQEQLTALVGEGTAGSIASMIQESIDTAVAALNNEEDPDSLAGKIKAVSDTVAGLGTSFTELEARVKANEDAIAVLNGGELEEGSVKKQVSDAVAAIVAGAGEDYDTLVEISNWITTHAESAAAMNTQIINNGLAVEALEALVGTLPEGIVATDVVSYIAEAIAAAGEAEDTAVDQKIAAAKEELTAVIDTKARIYIGTEAPADMTENDLFFLIEEDEVPTPEETV